MSTNYKDASFVTLRNQNKMLYANYIIQQNRVQSGCQLRIELENGSVGEASTIPKLLEGSVYTTLSEQAYDISSNSCPAVITLTTSSDPYRTDNIYLSLTTNQEIYRAAPAGTWIGITATEYATLQTNITGTSLAGTTQDTFNVLNSTAAWTNLNAAAANISSPGTPPIKANTYLYACAIKSRSTPTTTLSTIRLIANANTSTPPSTFTQIGPILSTFVASTNYFVLKSVSSINAPTDGLLGFHAPGNGTTTGQSYNIVYALGLPASNGANFFFSTNLVAISTGAVLASDAAGLRAYAIQALTTPTIQWITS
jgi:hypothetical protein